MPNYPVEMSHKSGQGRRRNGPYRGHRTSGWSVHGHGRSAILDKASVLR